jgi:uncharacterized NAD(P)/FAD-binding protein YdhS
MNDIIIIGGGLSGSLLLLNLLQNPAGSGGARITLVDPAKETDLGPAYSTDEDYLLNVPCGIMGAYSAEPEHFYSWAMEKGWQVAKQDFLPRKLYREYIRTMLRLALQQKDGHVTFERIQASVTNISITAGRAVVSLENGANLFAGKVVLAIGNFLPRHPEINNRSFIHHKSYFQNPWNAAFFSSISPDDTVFCIGTGQTTVDVVTGLYRHNHQGKIITISRKGLLPMVHKITTPYPSFYGEIKNLDSIPEIFKVVRKHFQIAEKVGSDRRAVIDSLRPDSQRLWLNLDHAEKSRFLRHLFRYWEIIRSRIPPENEESIQRMLQSGQLNIIKGRLTDLVPSGNTMDVHYKPSGGKTGKTEQVKIVVNCMGPETDYTRIEQPLVINLLKNGLIEPDPLHLGMNALPDGSVITGDGNISEILYTLGLPLRGILWEVLAVPEIRMQAENLSRRILPD